MSYNWIDVSEITMDVFLMFDRWIIDYIMNEKENINNYNNGNRDYKTDMGKALFRYPYVIKFCKQKAPECAKFIEEAVSLVPINISLDELRRAELSILDFHDTFVVYAYPEIMETVNYIRNWKPKILYDLIDLEDKIVLDVGAGTGRLTFAAAKKAKRVYASEPCDTLREYMRDKIKSYNITNIKVLDGIVTNLPYENDTFDVVMSGHVVGDFYDEEISEMTRVTKNGGWIVCCNGDDEYKRLAPDKELVVRGFEYFKHESIEKGMIYNYRMQVIK